MSAATKLEDTKGLIDLSQKGDEFATEQLMRMIRDHHMPSRTRRFRNRNVLLEDSEIESEFLLGCYKAVGDAKLDVGNPLLYILWKGGLAVTDAMRKAIKHGIAITCRVCQGKTMGYRNRRVVCGKCGSTEVITTMIVVNEATMKDEAEGSATQAWDRLDSDDVHRAMDMVWSIATYDVMVSEIRKRLNGRVLELFDVMVEVNRDTSPNYLAEIAQRWGVTTAAVSVYLRKLRTAIDTYMQT